MINKSKIKLIRSLEQKKFRDIHQLFVVEGDKTVREVINSALTVYCVLARKTWIEQASKQIISKVHNIIIEIDEKELSQISFLKTPNQALAIVRVPHHLIDFSKLTNEICLYLDNVQDPGNLGTIIRLADWFGIESVICSEGCADPLSPKSVQSSMGAITRVKTYKEPANFLQKLKEYEPDFPVYGTFLNGENIYNAQLATKAMIVMGNESKGISNNTANYVNRRLLIPKYLHNKNNSQQTAESLNVAAATAIVCSEFRRRIESCLTMSV